MATVHDHRWTEPDAPRWEGVPDYGRLPDAFASVTALSSYGSSRLLHGVSPAAPLQSTGACCDPFAPCDACTEIDQLEEAQAQTMFNRIEEIH